MVSEGVGLLEAVDLNENRFKILSAERLWIETTIVDKKL